MNGQTELSTQSATQDLLKMNIPVTYFALACLGL